MPTDENVYRFALFGRSDSGKTCILTALSMGHVSNPAGYTSTWLPHPPEAGRDPDTAEQYRHGREMLESARGAVGAGRKPDPTDLRLLLRYRFDFTTRPPHPRTYKAEFVDYSGELLDPRNTAAVLAGRLRGLLNEMDGLFVLAEAPRPGGEGARLSREFELLQQAFALLANERKAGRERNRTPVVLMLNKWDRRPDAARDPATRDAQVRAFLAGDPEPPHRALADYLAGAAAEGCFHAVGVSAFGQARVERRTDAEGTARDVELPPTTRPLPSFGLEDGFVWAARRRDEIDVEEFERKAGAVGYFSVNPSAAGCVRDEGGRLADRFPDGSEPRRRVGGAAQRVQGVVFCRRVLRGALQCALVLGLAVMGLGAVAAREIPKVRKAEADFARADVTDADLRDHQRFLDGYQHSRWNVVGWRIVSRDEAKALRDRIIDRREQAARAAVEGLKPDVLAQEESARHYLREFENGPFAGEAAAIVEAAEQRRREHAIETHIGQAEARLAQVKSGPPERSAVADLDRLVAAVPDPEHHTLGQKKRLDVLREEANTLRSKVVRQEKEASLRQLLANRRFEEAGVAARDLKDLGEDKTKFALEVMSQATEVVDEAFRGNKWSKIRSVVAELRRGWVNHQLLDGDQIKTLDAWEVGSFKGEDRELYAEVVKYNTDGNSDRQRCTKYLNSGVPAEHRRRQAEVVEYEKYLGMRDGELELTVTVTGLHMGDRTGFSIREFGCRVTIDGTEIFKQTNRKWAANSSYRVEKAEQLSHKLTTRKGQVLTVKAEMWNDALFGKDDLGSVKWAGTRSDLAGKWIELGTTSCYEDKMKPSSVKITVEGLPTEPNLPAYPES